MVAFPKEYYPGVNDDKHKKHRLKQKSTEFCLVNDLLYLKDTKCQHKRVLYKGKETVLKMNLRIFIIRTTINKIDFILFAASCILQYKEVL